MKKFLLIAAFVCAAAWLPAQDARSIIDGSRNRIDAKTTLTQAKLVVTNKSGSTSERVINEYSKKDAKGQHRLIVECLSPASIRGTRFLSLEKKGEDNDQFVKLPELGHSRRISGSGGSGSFLGTDASYDDISAISSRDVDKDTHTLLKEDTVDGHDCYVIQSVPKDSSFEYSKMISWIGKADKVLYKMEMYDKKGELEKVLEVQKLEEKQGYLTPMVTKLTTVTKGTNTTINVLRVQYNGNVPEAAFGIRYLETGKI
jgi:hypothetical protein